MSWTKIDDGILTHPKMQDAEERCPTYAWVLWTKALVYVNQYKLDGRITRRIAARFVPAKQLAAAVDALTISGLWDVIETDVFEFHNYIKRNATAAEREEKAKANAADQAAFRERQKQKRKADEEARKLTGNEPVSPYAADGKALTVEGVSEDKSRAAAPAYACDPVPSRPVPS